MKSKRRIGRDRTTKFILLTLILGAVTFIMPHNPVTDFEVNLWFPANRLLQGTSPYQDLVPTWHGLKAVWFPSTVGAFVWLGVLPLPTAQTIWLFLTTVCLLCSVLFIVPLKRTPLWQILLVGLGVSLFPATIVHYTLAQVTIIVIFALLLCQRLIEEERYVLAAILLAAVSAKPQLLVLPIMGFALYIMQTAGWQGLARMAIVGITASVIFTLPLWLADRNWITGLFENLSNNPAWLQPTLLDVLQEMLGGAALLLYLPFVVLLFVINWRIWSRYAPSVAILWSMALNVVQSPYMWSWDFVMVLPLLIHTFVNERDKMGYSLYIGAYLIIWLGTIFIRAQDSNEFFAWWVPYVALGAILLSDYRKRNQSSYDE